MAISLNSLKACDPPVTSANFAVWAPSASTVDLHIGNQIRALSPIENGWWRCEVDADFVTQGYKYSIDGGEPLPDPRSRWQPDGVHGNSYWLDAGRLRKLIKPGFKQKPLKDSVIYELHIGTFTPAGTYAAAESKLSYLADLGITHVELMPLATFPGGHGWGYDGVYWYAPLPAYGSPESLISLVNACHNNGLAVLLDVVYNHLGPDGNYLNQFGPYLTDRIKTPWGDSLNFDGPHSNEVRRFVIDNALMWLRDYGFDGLRLDAVHTIYSFEAVHVLEELALELAAFRDEAQRTVLLIAESDLNDPKLVRCNAKGGFGLDAQWSDDFHHAVHRYFTNEEKGVLIDFSGIKDIAMALNKGFIYRGQYSKFRLRNHGRELRDVLPSQLIVCSQNHDQVGNRAKGERLSMLLKPIQLKAIAALVLLGPFTPMLFQGEEWGAATPFLYFTDHQDPELVKLVHEGRQKDFASFWQDEVADPQAAHTFQQSQLNWAERDDPLHQDLLEWYRVLIRLRRDAPPADTFPQVRFDEQAGWLTFTRGRQLVALNLASHPQHVPHPEDVALEISSVSASKDPNSEFAPFEARLLVCGDSAGIES